jgi:hypothetical protein
MRTLWFPTRKTITAVMHGEHERAKGSAAITLDRVNSRICFKFTWSGIGSPVAAHIYNDAGGCAVLPLFVDTPKRRGCVKAEKALLKKIADCPGKFHVKLQTQRYPQGALQAQLARS